MDARFCIKYYISIIRKIILGCNGLLLPRHVSKLTFSILFQMLGLILLGTVFVSIMT